eukprot:197682-Amorphochlora_amoeboformis.AAC.1
MRLTVLRSEESDREPHWRISRLLSTRTMKILYIYVEILEVFLTIINNWLPTGFEFFGGNVNAKWLSALFVDDDAFDTDEGYNGKLQFLFALVDKDGDHAAEMDSKNDASPRSFPIVSGATFI